MKKVIISLSLILCSACASGNMYHSVHGRDYRQYLLEKECCEIKNQMGGQRYNECMKEWRVVSR
jgi:hypothetical protein